MRKTKRNPNKKKKHLPEDSSRKWFLSGLFLVVFVFLLFSPSLSYEFVNWDDDINVYENENVIHFDVKGIFTEHVIGNYNPLAILTFAAEYKMVGENPRLYHLNNLILHVISTILVLLLMKKLGLSFMVSFLAAVLFGIHPMRVESVVWITERKDVLFSVFFLGSLVLYIEYIKRKRFLLFFLSLGMFVFSLLSKIQAVALAPVLLLIDYWFSRKPDRKLIAEKIPYFLLALAAGFTGIWFLKQQGSLDAGSLFAFHQRIFIGSYSFMVYSLKSVFPWEMSALYPYPAKLSFMHYLSIIPAVAVISVPFFSYKSNKLLTFGILFFLLNVLFLLQVLGAGQGFLADRFTYIPYIGLFMVYAGGLEAAIKLNRKHRSLIFSVLAVYLVVLSVVAFNRIKVWENSETLWTDVIDKYPDTALPYNNLGHYLRRQNDYERALENYNKAIYLEPDKSQTYNNRGKIYFDQGEIEKAVKDYSKCLELQPDHVDALANRGAAYGMKQNWEEALKDLELALEINPFHSNALSNRAFVWFQLQEYKKSIEDFRKYLQVKPNDPDVINSIGLCYYRLKNYKKALEEFTLAIRLNPSTGAYFVNRSLVFYALGEKGKAWNDVQMAAQSGFRVDEEYLNHLKESME